MVWGEEMVVVVVVVVVVVLAHGNGHSRLARGSCCRCQTGCCPTWQRCCRAYRSNFQRRRRRRRRVPRGSPRRRRFPEAWTASGCRFVDACLRSCAMLHLEGHRRCRACVDMRLFCTPSQHTHVVNAFPVRHCRCATTVFCRTAFYRTADCITAAVAATTVPIAQQQRETPRQRGLRH